MLQVLKGFGQIYLGNESGNSPSALPMGRRRTFFGTLGS